MAHFNGKITSGGRVVLAGVQGEVFMRVKPNGWRSWDGTIDLQQGQFIGPGSYRLELDDGRSGDILITNAHYSSHSAPGITFSGSGPLQ